MTKLLILIFLSSTAALADDCPEGFRKTNTELLTGEGEYYTPYTTITECRAMLEDFSDLFVDNACEWATLDLRLKLAEKGVQCAGQGGVKRESDWEEARGTATCTQASPGAKGSATCKQKVSAWCCVPEDAPKCESQPFGP